MGMPGRNVKAHEAPGSRAFQNHMIAGSLNQVWSIVHISPLSLGDIQSVAECRCGGVAEFKLTPYRGTCCNGPAWRRSFNLYAQVLVSDNSGCNVRHDDAVRTSLAIERLTLLSAQQVRFRELKEPGRLPQTVSPTTPIDKGQALGAERPTVIGVAETDRGGSRMQWAQQS